MAAHEQSKNVGFKRRLALSSAAALLVSSFASCSGEKAPATCESPRATSDFFPADPSATEEQATWKNGIAIRTEAPAGATGVIVGYRGPNTDRWNDSLPISTDRAQLIAVRIGNGTVSFSVKVVASEGSAACANKPNATFSQVQPMQPFIDADATLPQW